MAHHVNDWSGCGIFRYIIMGCIPCCFCFGEPQHAMALRLFLFGEPQHAMALRWLYGEM